MQKLQQTGLVAAIKALTKPVLGICVGAQMLGLGSAEGVEPGLGWLDMTVERFPELPNLRVPHMGWNQVTATPVGHSLTQDMTADTRFYFVHSYHVNPVNPNHVAGETDYGVRFTCAIARDNIFATQFHPEKSADDGLKQYSNFIRSDT